MNFETFMICEEDHLKPICGGGKDTVENIVTACAVCNRLKGSYEPDFELTEKNRANFIADIRSKIMEQRSKHMGVFTNWTHSHGKTSS